MIFSLTVGLWLKLKTEILDQNDSIFTCLLLILTYYFLNFKDCNVTIYSGTSGQHL